MNAQPMPHLPSHWRDHADGTCRCEPAEEALRRQLAELGVPEIYHDAAVKIAWSQVADQEAEYERERLADGGQA